MDLAVRQLAEKQHGLFTTGQVHLVGSSRKAVRHALAAHEIIRLTRGLYVLADHYPSTTVERHLQLARGALLLVPDGVLSHWTALLAHGIPVVTVPPEVRLRRPVSSECLGPRGGRRGVRRVLTGHLGRSGGQWGAWIVVDLGHFFVPV
ncbi:type IV toxin-antitoxin system AbiEi family antitoxin domain-containing protein, partial [Ornithinimicrobium cryptoxanthini]